MTGAEADEGRERKWAIPLIFTKRLRDGVRRGEITCSVRISMRPHVKAANRYRLDEGQIEVESVVPIKVAQHGKGENVYLVRFHYVRPPSKLPAPRASTRRRPPQSGIAVRRNPRPRFR